MKTTLCLAIAVLLLIPGAAFARGATLPRSSSPGTGSKSASTRVGGYTKKDATHVDSYRRSTADTKFENNWSTKGNLNPVTGKEGSRVTPPSVK